MHQAANRNLICVCIVLFLCSASDVAFAQQSYTGNLGEGNCSYMGSTTSVIVGYTCSQALPTCQTYAYYRAQQSQSLSDVASLFSTNISALTATNPSVNTSPLSSNQPLFIPLSCSCPSVNYSLMDIPYTIRSQDTFFKIANSTYQGLTTCTGIETSNPSVDPTTLSPGSTVIHIPLRCACPSELQVTQGINLLITYSIVPGDDPYKIRSAFGVDDSLFHAANSLSQDAVIYPQTTVLIPLKQKPQTAPFVASNVSPTASPSSPPESKKSSHVGTYVGIAIGACVALSLLVLAALYVRKRKSTHGVDPSLSEAALMQESDANSSGIMKKHEIDMREINHKLFSYSRDEIIAATEGFDASNHIKGSVYHGVLRDQMVAIKKIDRNISKEIAMFKSLHHSNLVALLGVCIGLQESYLVYPFIGEGSLKDWLHEFPHIRENSRSLSWSARMRIATDIASALEYLHTYTKPSFLHKNVASSNILVDANFRGKLSNFGLAKSSENMEQGLAWTSHIEGTQGYLAPEYMNDGLLSTKTDVFAFGVVLLEMLSGELPILRDNDGLQLPGKHGFLWQHISTVLQGDDTVAQENLINWMDPMLKGQYPIHCAMKMLLLAKRCVASDPALRPSMSFTAARLMEILEASEKFESGGSHDGILGR